MRNQCDVVTTTVLQPQDIIRTKKNYGSARGWERTGKLLRHVGRVASAAAAAAAAGATVGSGVRLLQVFVRHDQGGWRRRRLPLCRTDYNFTPKLHALLTEKRDGANMCMRNVVKSPLSSGPRHARRGLGTGTQAGARRAEAAVDSLSLTQLLRLSCSNARRCQRRRRRRRRWTA